EVLAFRDGAPLPFGELQKRIGRKTVPKRLLTEAPVILMAYDLLEHQGQDIRDHPFIVRRGLLEEMTATLPPNAPLRLSPLVNFADWPALGQERARSRNRNAEGLMLKRRDSPYLAG